MSVSFNTASAVRYIIIFNVLYVPPYQQHHIVVSGDIQCTDKIVILQVNHMEALTITQLLLCTLQHLE